MTGDDPATGRWAGFWDKVTKSGRFVFVTFFSASFQLHSPTVCLPWTNIFLCFHFYVLFGVLLEGMVDSSLLSKDELLTPNIDGVMTL